MLVALLLHINHINFMSNVLQHELAQQGRESGLLYKFWKMEIKKGLHILHNSGKPEIFERNVLFSFSNETTTAVIYQLCLQKYECPVLSMLFYCMLLSECKYCKCINKSRNST